MVAYLQIVAAEWTYRVPAAPVGGAIGPHDVMAAVGTDRSAVVVSHWSGPFGFGRRWPRGR